MEFETYFSRDNSIAQTFEHLEEIRCAFAAEQLSYGEWLAAKYAQAARVLELACE